MMSHAIGITVTTMQLAVVQTLEVLCATFQSVTTIKEYVPHTKCSLKAALQTAAFL
jgi:hypothetical protein